VTGEEEEAAAIGIGAAAAAAAAPEINLATIPEEEMCTIATNEGEAGMRTVATTTEVDEE
jgi:hypothetical protein